MEDYLRLARFMVPLACTTIATDIGEQALNRGVAFSENVTASYGLAFSLTKFMAGTLQQNRHIGLIMVQQARDGRRAVALTAAMGLVVAAVHLLIALTPLGYLLIERAHQVDSVVGAGSRRAMLFLTAFPLLDGLAYVFIGMLLQYHHSLIVGASSIADVCVQVAVSVALMETALQTTDPLLIPILALYACSYSGYVLVCLQVAVSLALMETALQTTDPLLIPILALYACSYSGYVICLVQVAVSVALMETALQTTDPLLIPILALYACSYSGYLLLCIQVAVSLALYTCSYSGYVICLVQVAVSVALYACSYSGYVICLVQVAVSVALYACSYSGYVICLVQVAVSVALYACSYSGYVICLVQVAVSVALYACSYSGYVICLVQVAVSVALYACSYSGYVICLVQVAVSVALYACSYSGYVICLVQVAVSVALYACSYSGYVLLCLQVAVSLALMETALQTSDPLLIPILALYACSYSGYVICLVQVVVSLELYACSYSGYVLLCLQVAVSLALMETALQTSDPLLIPILALYACSYSGYVICLVQVVVSLELYACSYSGYVLLCLQVAVSLALMETALQTSDPLLIPILALYACSYSGYVICLVQVAVSLALYACSYSGYVICLVQVAVSVALYACSYSGYVICLVQVAVSVALYGCSYSGYVICLVQVAVSVALYACSYSGYVLVCLQVAVSLALMETALQTTDPLLIPILALYACSYSGYVLYVDVAVSLALMETALQTTDPLLIPILALYAAMAVRLALIVAGFLYKVGPKIRHARPLADKDSFTVVRALKFWWPLALVTAVNRISRPIINLLVARELGGSDAVEAVAVLTVTYPIGHLPYAWLNEMKSLAPAFRKSGQGRRVVPWRTLWKFSCICLLLTLTVSLVLFYVPGITFAIMTGWIETSADIARLCRKPLQIFTFVAVPVSIRAYLTSWLMVQKRTWILTPSAIFRTVALVTALLVLPKLSIRGADMGIAALLTGFLAEVSVVAVGFLIVRRKLRNPAQTTDGDNTETEGTSSQCHDEADRPMLEEKETSL
ncbi:uncharacterized protein LOC118420106 [Branchiostoma floridae]|uniref:Uncharacterized protein LOC118420106 n=1 Tax=Branchiostoma floridae TaxID=7739 RepID=A0A9J7MWL8_BRAFL|nr:uncharacterized protein LOC118420106 [Branchiostoma floridae]